MIQLLKGLKQLKKLKKFQNDDSLEIRNLPKGDIKYKLSQMGMSFDRTNYPKEHYVQLYLDKSNAKNKVTRNNTPFNKEKIMNRERERIKNSSVLKRPK